MKFTGILLLVVVMALVLDESEAFRLRRAFRRIRRGFRKVVRAVKKVVCRSVCTKVCPKVGPLVGATGPVGTIAVGVGCHVGCKKICKRSIALPDYLIGNDNYEIVAMSPEFSHYDLDQDKMITIDEFSRAEMLPYEEVEALYHFADVDGDGALDMDEFETAPFVFTMEMAKEMNVIAKNVHLDAAVDPEVTDQTVPDMTSADSNKMSPAFNPMNFTSPANMTSNAASAA